CAHIRTEPLTRPDREDATEHPGEHAEDGESDHQRAGLDHDVQIVDGHTLIDDALDQAWLHEIHGHLERHHEWRQDDQYLVCPEIGPEATHRSHEKDLLL